MWFQKIAPSFFKMVTGWCQWHWELATRVDCFDSVDRDLRVAVAYVVGPLGQLIFPHARYNQLTWWLEHSRKDWSFPDFSGHFWAGRIRMEAKIMETSFYGQQTTGKWRWAVWVGLG